MNFAKLVSIALALCLSADLPALYVAPKLTNLPQYLNLNYPHIHHAIQNDTYADLALLDPHLMIGATIADVSDNSLNYSRSILVGAHLVVSENATHQAPAFDFSFADLSFANFSLADLSRANLSHAKAYEADLSQSLLECSSIKGLDVRNANLHKTRIRVHKQPKYVTRMILDFCGAIHDDSTHIRSPLAYKSASHYQEN